MSEWQSADHAFAYLERADRVPHRSAGETALLDEIPPAVRRVLDLGSGDGRLLEMVLSTRPNATGVALDFSPLMLEQLQGRFAHRTDVEVVNHNLDDDLPPIGKFDAVVSSFAIHHLDHERKRRLYEEIWAVLEPGGVFCNLEHVASASTYGHERFLLAAGITAAEEDPSNKLLDVQTQLGWLDEIGFADVDCYWKWRELALLVGRKPAAITLAAADERAVAAFSSARSRPDLDFSTITFRPLRSDEFDLAHGILVSAADWLLSKGIRQWTIDYPRDRYLACHENGWNYALEADGELAAVVTLSQEAPAEWADRTAGLWLSKLATAPAFRGRGAGALAVRCAIGAAYNQDADRLYLDCVQGNGFLVHFYRGLGFRPIDRRDVQFSTGRFDMVLMELQMIRV